MPGSTERPCTDILVHKAVLTKWTLKSNSQKLDSAVLSVSEPCKDASLTRSQILFLVSALQRNAIGPDSTKTNDIGNMKY